MTILPVDPVANATPEALRAFLETCRAAAARDGHAKLVSISIAVEALDPLAVLESIFEPDELHFYAERPSLDTALAGAEAVLACEAQGADRFAAIQRFIDETLAHTIAVGQVNAAFGGPHFFTSFTFASETEPGELFPAARAFVPRWQVARAGDSTTAVANLLVTPEAPLDALAEKVWRAHAKFRGFEYGAGSGTGILPVMESEPVYGRDARATTEPRATQGGGTGILPVEGNAQAHGRDARATWLGLGEVHIRQGANLPHWASKGAIYAVTFRLADSVPPEVREEWRTERARLEGQAKEQQRALTPHEERELERLHSEKIEAFLDSGMGACHLRVPEIAGMVAGALQHFEGSRYVLHEWCVMPNHVHAVLQPLESHSLAEILHSWKSYTAKEANRLLRREGEFWQVEYYDHLIRDEHEYARTVEYIRHNPEKAGLQQWRWQGSGTGILPVGRNAQAHGRDARATTEPHATQGSGTGILPATGNEPAHGRHARATSQPSITGGTPVPPSDSRTALSVTDHGDYPAAVQAALERITAGEFNKIVLARARTVEAAQPLHPLQMLNQLRQRFPECYAFSIANGRGQSFIGATPERLARVSQGVLETEALAGSAPRGASASEDARHGASLLRSEKERREQRMVLDSIARRLAPLGLSLEYPAEPVLRRLANVQHLLTPIRAALPAEVRLLDILAQLHPTPAVGGSPRTAAVARIRELEGFSRGLYAGALGWINARGGGEFFVGLRSALVDGRTARLFAGAGIVAGSSPERELAETELKFRAMQEALKL